MVPLWQDCGRAGNAVVIAALAVYEGKLYAGTYEPGKERGHVYRYEGGQEWSDLGSCDKSNKVSALAVYQGKLYAAMTCPPGMFPFPELGFGTQQGG